MQDPHMRPSTASDRTIRIRKDPIAVLPNIHEEPGWITGAAFHPSGDFFAVTFFHNNAIVLYDCENLRDPQIIRVMEKPCGDPARPHEIAFNPDGTYAVLCNYKSPRMDIFRWAENNNLTPSSSFTPPAKLGLRRPHSMAFHPSGEFLAVTYCDCKHDKSGRQRNFIVIYEFDSRRGSIGPSPRYVVDDPQLSLDNPKGVAFSPDGTSLIASMCDANTIAVYDFEPSAGEANQSPRQIIDNDAIALSRPEDLMFSADSRYLSVVSAHSNAVLFLGFDGASQAVTPDDRPLEILDNPEARLSYPHAIAFSPSSKHFVVANFGRRWLKDDREDIVGVYEYA